MSLKQTIKAKVCIVTVTPNYPLGNFVAWADSLDKHELLHYLNEIQQELDEEEKRLRDSPLDPTPFYSVLRTYWCVYCEQIRSYYRAIIRNPACASRLSFLL